MVILPAAYDGVGEHRGAGEAALNGQLDGWRGEHACGRPALAILAPNVLYVMATTTHEAGRCSSTSRVSAPTSSNASRPSVSTSGGRISIATRGSESGNGFLAGFLRYEPESSALARALPAALPARHFRARD